MTALPHLPLVEVLGFNPNAQFQPGSCEDLAAFEDFQASACSAFSATLNAAKGVQREFCSLLAQLNSLTKWPTSGLNREKLLQRLVIEAAVPYTGPRYFHISLNQQFSRIFLKRRKVQYSLHRLKCVVFGPANVSIPGEDMDFSLLTFTSQMPVRPVLPTEQETPILAGQTTHRGPLTAPLSFAFKFTHISADLPGGVLTLVVICSNSAVEPLAIPNIVVKSLRKKFKFTSD